MYRTDLDSRHKSGAFAGVIAVHLALGLALAHLSGTVDLAEAADAIAVLDLQEIDPPPPPPPPPPPRQDQSVKPKEEEGGSAPENIRSEPTPVVAPEPGVELPAPPVVATSETPREGTAPTQGAAAVRGPGTGAGGTGTGTGSGSGLGSGPGGGGDGLAATRTRMVSPTLRGRDFPPSLLEAWPPGAWAYMRLRVDAEGNVMQCIMDRGTGNPALDSQICAVARQRLRFRPALDRNGRRVADWAGYRQEPPR